MPIIQFIQDTLKENESSTLIDLFCGNGFFSILFGESFQNLIGYDWVESSINTAIKNLKHLIGKKPIFGICLGHQLLALAFDAKTFKLKYGHRGGNHPVKNLLTQKIEITSQNHGFAVDPETLDKDTLEVTHINLNDGTNEGFRHKELPVFSVQYHPEASPGPHDSDYLFSSFMEMMKTGEPVTV